MQHRIPKSVQRRKTSKSGSSHVGENDDIAALLHNSQSSHAATQVSSIRALQPLIGNQAILRLISQDTGQTGSQGMGRILQRDETTPVKAEEQEEDEFESVDLTTDIEDVDTEGEVDSDDQVSKSQAEIDSDSLPSNAQMVSTPIKPNKEDKKKLGFIKHLKQFLPGKSGKAGLKSGKSAIKGVKGFRKAIKPTKEAVKAGNTLAPTLAEFITNIAGTGITKILSTAIDLVSKAVNSNAIQEAISFLIETLQPMYESIITLLEPLIDVIEVASDALPFVGGVIQILKSAVGIISGVVSMIMRSLTAKTLLLATGSKSDVVKDVSWYGLRKVLRSVLQKTYDTGRSVLLMMRGITNLALDIAAVCTYGAAEIGKAVTLAVGIADSLGNLALKGGRSIKGIVKALAGTRGVGRENNATSLVDAAIKGDTAAQGLIVGLGAYGMSGRIARALAEGKNAIIDNIAQPIGNATGLDKKDATEITIAFYQWGKDKMNDFYVWVKSKFTMLTEKGVFTGVFKTLWNLLKDMFSLNTNEATKFLQDDIQTHGADKKHPWRKTLIQHLALKFKSS